jgi:hypothetical protein
VAARRFKHSGDDPERSQAGLEFHLAGPRRPAPQRCRPTHIRDVATTVIEDAE